METTKLASNAQDSMNTPIETKTALGSMTLVSSKTSGDVTLTFSLDKLRERLADDTYFRHFAEQYGRNALNLNGTAWMSLKQATTDHDEWLAAICLPTVRVTDKDKADAHEQWPLVSKLAPEKQAKAFELLGLPVVASEAAYALALATKRVSDAEAVKAAKAAKHAAFMESLKG